MITFKPGVIIHFNDILNTILDKVGPVYALHGYKCVVTAGRDGKHMEGSKHYDDHALDFRTRDIKQVDLNPILWEIRQQLGNHYDVVLETTHLHLEWDPKYNELESQP